MSNLQKFLEEKRLTIHKEFSALYRGWDCDGTYYLCKDMNDIYVLVCTSHGSPYIGSPEELQDKIEEYEEVLKATRDVYLLLREQSESHQI